MIIAYFVFLRNHLAFHLILSLVLVFALSHSLTNFQKLQIKLVEVLVNGLVVVYCEDGHYSEGEVYRQADDYDHSGYCNPEADALPVDKHIVLVDYHVAILVGWNAPEFEGLRTGEGFSC